MKKQVFPVFAKIPRCPSCGAELNAIAGIGWPDPGDFNVCALCLAVLRFLDEPFTCRLALPEEVEQEAAAGELTEKDADLLRGCFARRAKRKGLST